ncbi:MAG: OadG family transporter subunit [Propionivibrio sp.]
MDNLGWGLQITALGMGLVFVLLALLWGLLTLVLALDRERDETAQPGEPSRGASLSPADGDLPGDLVAAIAAAVLRHRSTRLRAHSAAPREDAAGSLWVATGRTRQNTSWQPRGK